MTRRYTTEQREAAAELRAARIPIRGTPEPVYEMSFGEQFVETLGEFVDAKISYANSRLSSGAEWANPEPVEKAATALQQLLDRRVRVV